MAYYSAGILICLCLYFICWASVASDGNDARNGYKGRYGPEPVHYEVVVPLKVTEAGQFVSHTIPHHYKRSYYGTQSQKNMGPQDMVHYIVPIAGEKHHLELLPSNNIVSPGMVVEVHDNKGISQREMHRLGNIQCHYTGSVRGQEDSRAALSTCYGLSGYVRTRRGYYLIEPAPGHNPLSGTRHPHLLYQHEEYSPEWDVNCATSGNLAKILANRATTEDNVQEDGKINKSSRCNVSELHIEAMVVLDKTLLNYHKEVDVENYVLTVFNMAHDLYHDATLGTNINLAIVRMIRLEEEEHKMNLAMNKDAKKTLEFFRDWQNKMNPGDDTHPNHHDVAVLLTRLAIPHDTLKESGCNATLPEGLSTVMNPSVGIRTAEWSSCSPKFLKLFIDQGFGKCLYDPPTDHSFEMPDILPGVMYGGDFQCRELLGPNAALCDTGIECQNLICYVEDKGCIETHTAAAPGTNCGEKQWCYRGKCLTVGGRPGAVDGEWSRWSPWSECSRTCGSGIASQERHCDNPAPTRGGKYCIGEHKHHRICNTEPCDAGEPSFRNVQCAEFNDWMYPEDNKMHEWKAYHMVDENPCILFCMNDEGEVASLRPRVVDGTKCLRGMRDVCVDGICREIPCDLDLESNAVEDWCGICHGDGTACEVITGEKFFAQKVSNTGKAKLVDIPAGSMNIKIEESEPSEAKIQVGSKDGKTIFLQGDTFGMFNISGTKAWLGNIRTKQEALTLPGHICGELSIWIETLDNVTMKYSYGVKSVTKRTPVFDWDYVDWSKCSAQCGPGTQEAVSRCMEKAAGLVDDSYCQLKKRPKEQIRPCEIAPCIPRWMIGDWQKCMCPQRKRMRVVKCVKPTGEGEGESDVITDSECAGPKPKEKDKCNCDSFANANKRNTAGRKVQIFSQDGIDLMQNEQLLNAQKNRRSSCLLAASMKGTECDKPITTSKPILIDQEDPKCLKLVLHTECEGDNKDNQGESGTVTFESKEALKFLNEMEKDYSNNKTRV